MVIRLKRHSKGNPNALLDKLHALGYRRAPMVLEAGDMASRGSIVDVFAQNYTAPIRLDFFGEELDRLNTFDVHSQRSLSALETVDIVAFTNKKKQLNLSMEKEPDLTLLSAIKPGDYVVHESHGIAVFSGLVQKQISSVFSEYLELHYKGKDRLFVPVNQIDRVHAFSDADRIPAVNGLYDGSWGRIQARAKRDIKALVEDIYHTQQARLKNPGFAFQEDNDQQLEMESDFQYKETPDQLAAIDDIKRDMQSEQVMDRVICGDVGFGKTEVILRAAFKAVQSFKQVVVLVPTTVLASQHYKTFKKRLEKFAVNIALLARTRSPKENKSSIEAIKKHQIDIVIGTHRLLQNDVSYADLGLIIVDEEQRFGVAHKEKLKQLKQNVDVLAVSATPIPRTLYMALTGSRQFSTLKTPPQGRQAIHTSVMAFDKEVVKNAIKQELDRGGQVYYLYNNIAEIDKKAAQLKKLIPHLRIGIGHGKLSPSTLETLMSDFYEKQYDVLLCTTIIENGLDIPHVNSIIIEKAENLGLSQIHQIRGRVGRSNKDAYAWVMYSNENLSELSRKRLNALKEYVALGSGYRLALKDLEIRGAGSLLGESQHGHMTAIGFDLYCKLLKDSLAKRKGERVRHTRPFDALGIQLYIPESYVSSPRERYALYQRLIELKDIGLCEDLEIELEDRYGAIPSSFKAVLNTLKNVLANKS